MLRFALLFAVPLFLAASAFTAYAADSLSMLDLSNASGGALPPGWELKVKKGAGKAFVLADEGVKAVCLKGENASFSIQRKISVDVKEYPYVTWRWKVTDMPKGADFRKSDKDDQAAQLFVAFGRKSISYIWDTTAPVGSEGGSSVPLVMSVKIVVVDSGQQDAGKWVTVTRNVYEDYKRLYGKEPPTAEGLRFQINSQYTHTKAQSCLASVEFRKKPL